MELNRSLRNLTKGKLSSLDIFKAKRYVGENNIYGRKILENNDKLLLEGYLASNNMFLKDFPIPDVLMLSRLINFELNGEFILDDAWAYYFNRSMEYGGLLFPLDREILSVFGIATDPSKDPAVIENLITNSRLVLAISTNKSIEKLYNSKKAEQMRDYIYLPPIPSIESIDKILINSDGLSNAMFAIKLVEPEEIKRILNEVSRIGYVKFISTKKED